jgi:hypothetical protein
MAAIERAKVTWAGRGNRRGNDRRGESPQRAAEPGGIRRSDSDDDGEEGECCASEPYRVASFRITTNQAVHELAPAELARVVSKIVEVEGPIHRDEITRRVTQIWGLRRTGKRIRDAVSQALGVASRRAAVIRDGEFFEPGDGREVTVRNRGDVTSSTLRNPRMLPPAEIHKAVTAIVRAHLGVARDEAVTEAARLFGFRTTSARLRETIEDEVTWLVAKQVLDERSGKLYIP